MNPGPRALLTLRALLIAAALTSGCSTHSPNDPAGWYRRGDYFDVIIKKAGPSKIHDVILDFPDVHRTFHYGGVFTSGALHSDGPNPLPKASTVTVSWRTEDGALHKRVMQLAPDLLPRKRDDLVFLFGDDDTLTIQRFAQSERDKSMKIEY